MKALKIVTAVILIIAVAITAYIVYALNANPFTNREMSAKAEAVVVETEKIVDDSWGTATVSIGNSINISRPGQSTLSFTTEDGEQVTAEFPWYFIDLPEDNTMDIIYLRDDPTQITLDSFFFHSVGVIILGITAFTFYMFGGVLLLLVIIVLRDQRKKKSGNTENYYEQ